MKVYMVEKTWSEGYGDKRAIEQRIFSSRAEAIKYFIALKENDEDRFEGPEYKISEIIEGYKPIIDITDEIEEIIEQQSEIIDDEKDIDLKEISEIYKIERFFDNRYREIESKEVFVCLSKEEAKIKFEEINLDAVKRKGGEGYTTVSKAILDTEEGFEDITHEMRMELKKDKFEQDLLSENVVDVFNSKRKIDLNKQFGENVTRAINFDQKNAHHCYDLWNHILHTVDEIKPEGLTQEQFKKLRIAAFFHDVGKPDVAKINPDTNQQTFYGHAVKSVEVAKPMLKQLGYSEEKIDQISFLIGHHDDFISYKTSIPESMKNHEYVREINVSSVAEVIIENKYDFAAMGYNKDQIKAISYYFANGQEPDFKDFTGKKIEIPVNFEEVREKMNSGKYNSKYNASLEDYKMLIQLCKADASAQSEKAVRIDKNGNEIVMATKEEKLNNMNKIELNIEEAYRIATQNTRVQKDFYSRLTDLANKKENLEIQKAECEKVIANNKGLQNQEQIQ